MITNEEKFKEINFKFCDEVQRLFVKFMDDLDMSKCIDEGVANEAIYSLGNNVASCIYDICETREIANNIEEDVVICMKETLDMLFDPIEKKKVTMLGDNVQCHD